MSTIAWAQDSLDPRITSAEALATFDEVWRLVRVNFYDPKLRGLDWDAVRATYRDKAGAAGSQAKLAAVINRMLQELRTTHTGYYTPADIAFYDLLTILSSSSSGLDGNLTEQFPGGVVSAEQAGLLVGDEIVDVDHRPFAPVESFRGKEGQQTTIAIRHTRNDTAHRISVVPQTITPGWVYLSAMEDSVRVIDAGGFSIGYIRVWTFYGKDYWELLQKKVFGGALRQTDGLILDMRDGWGGGSLEILRYFDPYMPVFETVNRQGVVSTVGPRWRSRVALIVNQGTRSMKELFTYGFVKYHYGDVIGTRTAGAALEAHGFLLKSGLLVLPISDVRVDGERLEGRGVSPTIEVPFDIRYANGQDPQFDRAVAVLVKKLQARAGKTASDGQQ
jgi:carboxyl-terminal processing protease